MPPAKRAVVSRAQIDSSLPPLKTLEVPKEVLSLILLYASQDENTSLVQLALVEKNFASIALPLLHESLQITSFQQLAKVVRHKKKKLSKETEDTKNLSIRLTSIYPSGITQGSAIASLKSLLTSVADPLNSLTIQVPSSAHNPLAYLFPKLTSLSQLSYLTYFRLDGEIWFDDLLSLLSCWTSLVSLSIGNLRGDCNSKLSTEPFTTPQLRKISLHKSTLTGTMIRYLLASQHELRSLELPIPGGKEDVEGRLAWDAIERLVFPVEAGGEGVEVKGLEVLKVWDRWGDQVAAHRRKEARKRGELKKGTGEKGKGKVKATVKDEEEEEETDQLASDADESNEKEEITHSPSPFLSIFTAEKSHHIRSLLLTTAYLPSSPLPDSFNSLLPHLSSISELTIEDTTSSGLRKLVEGALRKGKLAGLRELTSVGIKKRAVAVNAGKKKQTKKKDEDDEEDELDSEEEEEGGKGKGKGKEKEKEEEPVKEKRFVLSKTDLKFEKFCMSKGVQWRIEETVW